MIINLKQEQTGGPFQLMDMEFMYSHEGTWESPKTQWNYFYCVCPCAKWNLLRLRVAIQGVKDGFIGPWKEGVQTSIQCTWRAEWIPTESADRNEFYVPWPSRLFLFFAGLSFRATNSGCHRYCVQGVSVPPPRTEIYNYSVRWSIWVSVVV